VRHTPSGAGIGRDRNGHLSDTSRHRPVAGPGPERRLCSVLFADLVGFTPLSEASAQAAV